MKIDTQWEVGDKCWAVVPRRVEQTACPHCHHRPEAEWIRKTLEVEITSIEVRRTKPSGTITYYRFELDGETHGTSKVYRSFEEADATRLPDDCY